MAKTNTSTDERKLAPRAILASLPAISNINETMLRFLSHCALWSRESSCPSFQNMFWGVESQMAFAA